jgi:hypothetical protein
MVAAVIVQLTTASPVTGEQEQSLHCSNAEFRNLRLVIRNMTDDFQYFGIGRQQAEMLAEQTADFGTHGMLTTMAAVGIVPLLTNVIAFTNKDLPEPV